ncbi:MAG TPA: GntR family transcriptional regulator [Gaiellaceae bacterium]|nr:GntR family transcriptional regulator [Gaiellaceae bacterium]
MTEPGVGTASDIAYRELKSWILMGEIPLGMRLGEERIADRLSLSRTPVREALLRLYAERFLERHPEGGYRINHPTARSMQELYELRKALELYAVRRTIESPQAETIAILEELRSDWAALAEDAPELDPDFVLLDEDFHRRLAEASGNEELVEALRRVGERIRPVRTHDFLMTGRIDATIEQHLAIVAAAVDGSPDAEELLERHISESQSFVESAVGRVLEKMLTTGEGGLAW